ncbi:hypothetical protein HYALB_00008603 [Hymenoscyphus albidus]|uniref:Uncharacterized protein n=1 Tax=Hymenoscyphus albidus TaxID=595503 RepID=A0A9N9LDC3_9HELO|nr:hypothetical protein HYALB_00008603 [Hymenoscyphus albidus]
MLPNLLFRPPDPRYELKVYLHLVPTSTASNRYNNKMKFQSILVLIGIVNGINAFQYVLASCKNADNSLHEANTKTACSNAKSTFNCSDCTFEMVIDGSGNGGPPRPRCSSDRQLINDVQWGELCKALGNGAVGG